MTAKIISAIGIVLLLTSGVFFLRSRDVAKGDVDGALPPVTTTTVASGPETATTTASDSVAASGTTAPDEDGPSIADRIRVIDQPERIELPAPVSIRVGGIDIEAPVVPVGVEDDGQMEIPSDVDEIGWYAFGPSPGEAGSAVLAGHVSGGNQGRGVFYDLKRVEPGDIVEVDHEDGSTSRYEVVGVETVDKGDLPVDRIFSREGDPVLTLITCGGSFSRSLNSYDSNVVVVAVPLTPTMGNPDPGI